MSPLESLMREWLETGTGDQKLNARAWLATHRDVPVPSLDATPRATPVRVPLPPVRLRVLIATCPFRERCGCQAPRCHDPDFGPRYGYPEGPDYRVDQLACLECVGNLDRGLPSPD